MYSDQQKNAWLVDIFNPNKDDLDNALCDVRLYSYELMENYREEKELELFFQKATDAIVNDKDDAGKKIYTYPANARSKIDEENREKADRLVEVWILKKQSEVKLDVAKMTYYHVKWNIQNNDTMDKQSQIVWGMM